MNNDEVYVCYTTYCNDLWAGVLGVFKTEAEAMECINKAMDKMDAKDWKGNKAEWFEGNPKFFKYLPNTKGFCCYDCDKVFYIQKTKVQ